MTALLRSEFRKLLTVRSTYIISILALLLAGFLAAYVGGYKGEAANMYWLSSVFSNTSSVIGIFVALIAILLMGHEYRHNTIMHTLTIAKSRSKVMLAKVVAVTVFAIVLTVLITALAAVSYIVGVSLSPTAELVSPGFWWNDVWRALFYVAAYGLAGLALAVLLRHIVGAVASLFIIPIVQELLTLILKTNSKYLPFVALEQVHTGSLLSPVKGALVFLVYLVAAWVVAWILFLRRDAN